jgi:thiol-disulfide isomerase/thioredoxin
MRTSLSVAVAAFLLAGLIAVPTPAVAQSLAGLWDATVVVNTLTIPFRFEIAGEGAAIKGSFFNGDEKVTSTTGAFEHGVLTLSFDEYGSTLTATLKDGTLQGEYNRGTRGAPYPFQAKRFAPVQVGDAPIPSIAGLWNIQVKSSKGEAAWQLIVRQSGAEVSAAILRVDGDTGTLTGSYRDRKFVLSHFSGARPALLELTPAADGTLAVVQGRDAPLTAFRSDQARAKGLPEPSDPSRFTSVKDPTEPLRFSFPDLSGRIVSNTDEKFRGKVVIVNIGGSWCPNCHDEAPFLVDLYRKYRGQGLEIVLLSFEEAEQMKNPARVRAFIKRYGLEYTVLVPGEPRELAEKMPQGVNLNSFPTSFILGRDGRVRSVHAGFPGRASGEFHTRAKAEITATIEKLLSEPVQSSAR